MEQRELDYSTNYLKIIWENWYKVLAGTVICAVAGVVFTSLTPPTYQSTVTLLVYPPLFKEVEGSAARRTPAQMKLQLDEMMPRTFPVETYKIIAKSQDLIKEVIDTLEIENMSVEAVSRSLDVELSKLGPRGALYSQILLFHARSGNPQLAAQLAQTWAELFKERVDDLAWSGIGETYNLMESMWGTTRQELEKAEDDLEKFKTNWNLDLMKLEKEAREESLAFLKEQLDLTEIDVAAASAELAALQQELKNEDRIETLVKAPPDSAYWLLKKSSSTTGESSINSQDVLRTEEYNPIYITAREEEVLVQEDFQGLESRRKRLISRVEELRGEIALLQKDIAEQETVQIRLERDRLTFEATYQLVASKLEKGKIAKISQASDIQIAGNAVKPESPTGTRRLFKVAAAALVGVLISIGYVVADYSIRMSPSIASG